MEEKNRIKLEIAIEALQQIVYLYDQGEGTFADARNEAKRALDEIYKEGE